MHRIQGRGSRDQPRSPSTRAPTFEPVPSQHQVSEVLQVAQLSGDLSCSPTERTAQPPPRDKQPHTTPRAFHEPPRPDKRLERVPSRTTAFNSAVHVGLSQSPSSRRNPTTVVHASDYRPPRSGKDAGRARDGARPMRTETRSYWMILSAAISPAAQTACHRRADAAHPSRARPTSTHLTPLTFEPVPSQVE